MKKTGDHIRHRREAKRDEAVARIAAPFIRHAYGFPLRAGGTAMQARSTWILTMLVAACGSRDARVPEAQHRESPTESRAQKETPHYADLGARTIPAAQAVERELGASNGVSPAEKPAAATPLSSDQRRANPIADARDPASSSGAKGPRATEPARANAQPHVIDAPFRARPGRKLVGTAILEESEQGVKLAVDVRDARRGLKRVRLFRGEDCAAFGGGAGQFNSMDVIASDRLAPIGELPLRGGRGTRDFALPAAPIANPTGTAIVAFAPVPAHGGDVTEPIACAELPES